MDKQIIIGLILIFLIFIIGCIYVTHIKKIHEGFSDRNTFHDLMGHFNIPFSNTKDNDYTIYSENNSLNSRGYNLDLQANNLVNIQSSGKIDIDGKDGASIRGKEASMTMKNNNLNLAANSDINLESGDSNIKVSPESISLLSNKLNVGNNGNINLNDDNNINRNINISYTGTQYYDESPQFNNFDSDPTINANGKIKANLVEGTNAMQIADTIMHKEREGNGITFTADDSKFQNLHLGGLTGYNEDGGISYSLDANTGNFNTSKGKIALKNDVIGDDYSEFTEGDIKASKIYADKFYTTKTGTPVEIVNYSPLEDGNNQVELNATKLMFVSSDSKICFGSDENCFGLDQFNILKGTYFNIVNKDSENPENEDILKCTGQKCRTLENKDGRSGNDSFNFRIAYPSSKASVTPVIETPTEIEEAKNKFSNIVSDCCNGAGGEQLQSLVDQCKTNVGKKYKTKDLCEAAKTATFLYGDEVKTLTCGVDCRPHINNNGTKTNKWSMTGIYNLSPEMRMDANKINVERCRIRSLEKYKEPAVCYDNLNLKADEVIVASDSYYTDSLSLPELKCGSLCYTDSVKSGGKWRIYDQYTGDDDSEELATFNLFNESCGSKYNKSYGSIESYNNKNKIGRYIYNNGIDNMPDQVDYQCGTHKQDLYNNKHVVMEYKEDIDGTILGKSKNDAICSYYATKKFDSKEKCNATLAKLQDESNEENIEYNYGGEYCQGYYCKKKNGKWRIKESDDEIYSLGIVDKTYIDDFMSLFDEYTEIPMSETNKAELRKLMETLTAQGIYISNILNENLQKATSRYEQIYDSENVVQEVFDAVILDIDDYTTEKEEKKQEKKKEKKKERRKENSWKRVFD